MQVIYDKRYNIVHSIGVFITPPTDPNLGLLDIPSLDTSIFTVPGVKHINPATLNITLEPPPLPVVIDAVAPDVTPPALLKSIIGYALGRGWLWSTRIP